MLPMFSLVWIMPPRVMTRSAGRPVAEITRRGNGNDPGLGANGGVEGVNGNVEGANGGAPDFSMIIAQQLQNLLPAMQSQVSNRGNVGNQNGNVVNENVSGETWGMVLVMGKPGRLLYKEFLDCNPDKKYDVMRCKKLESELWKHAMVSSWHAAYNDRFSIRSARKREYGYLVQVYHPNNSTYTGGPCRICFNYNRSGHLEKDCRGVPRNVNPVNARNPTVRACYECGSTDHGRGNQGSHARGRAFMLGAEEALHDSNIVTVRIPLPNGKVLRVVGERPEEKARLLMSAKASDKKQEEIVVISRIFLSILMVAKSPYRLAPSEMEELSGQLKELRQRIKTSRTVKNRYSLPLILLIFLDQLQGRVFYRRLILGLRYLQLMECLRDDLPNDCVKNSLWTFHVHCNAHLVWTNAPAILGFDE
ncbi:hypothetical protein Tco_0058739 [Tanacetum coccineum]